MPTLELRDVWKKFGNQPALQGVNFTCRDGEMFCLLGPSGAGKSTTIRVISGLEMPDKGEVFLDGEEITKRFPQNRNMATAFESYALYPHLTVFDNMAFPLRAPIRAARYTQAEVEQRVTEVATMLNIGELLARYPKELSGGQRQRVALGRALVRKPKIYLLDEPIAHLDAKLRHRMRGELRKIQTELGVTTIYATPDQLEALSMADTIAVINKGQIEQIGEPDDIYYRPANLFVARFVGDPPMNIFDCRVTAETLIADGDTTFQFPISGSDQSMLAEKVPQQRIKVGIRPKDIELVPENQEQVHARGRVKGVDTLGQTTALIVEVDSFELKVKAATRDAPDRNDQVGIIVDNSRFYYFDSETGRRIG